MNSILKTATRINLRSLLNSSKNASSISAKAQQSSRNLWCLAASSATTRRDLTKYNTSKFQTQLCSCGAHTKAEKDLVEFLTEEIVAERKAQKSKTIPTDIDGFKAKLDGAEVTLTKTINDETIKIHFNVNHTVDTDAEPEISSTADKPDIGELKSKPSFKIDMVRDDTTVSLVCSFINADQQEDGYNDIFGIDEVSIYNGDWNENVYSVSGEVIDSYLYDLLLNYLDEKGITNEFIEKLSGYSTAYEHSAYISLLEGLSKFASGK
ncbi:hypothetical protein PPYR_14640 [Photinus pyralis]|uniref:Complement component 1 Q subcomponent-binding protein, mitochondrial n=1 Tax=Photinus pyralis TaxID=7054 RepID=A0A1Y1JZ08_PHOPY|nr:complement component 1 Q subcomponent-binding protein, mitochondrial [Photinus pyralis]KAB0792681.1 hypothetical protein PPYR_14640 [Photinus pyralis]